MSSLSFKTSGSSEARAFFAEQHHFPLLTTVLVVVGAINVMSAIAMLFAQA